MFRLGRRQSPKVIDLHVDVSSPPKAEPESESENVTAAHTDLDTTTDSKFLAMIAQLDTSLADLLLTCDRIEQAVAAS